MTVLLRIKSQREIKMVIIITAFRNFTAITKRKKKAFLLLKITPDTQKQLISGPLILQIREMRQGPVRPVKVKCKCTQNTYYLYK